MQKDVIPEVFILGSGGSLGNLTPQEIEHINRAECVLALNKFMAFYKMLDIMPTHVFFVDTHPGSGDFLQYIFDVCMRDNIQGLTFILDHRLRWRISSFVIEQLARHTVGWLKRRETLPMFRVPSNVDFEYIARPNVSEGDSWATSLQQPLFHFRGSLTTALNYVSIKYPNRRIKLVGVDMNTAQYFFQSELEKLEIKWQDWTTPIIAKEGLHFSAIKHNGVTMFDRFDYVIQALARTNNEIVNCYRDSLLVTKGFTPYSPVISQ